VQGFHGFFKRRVFVIAMNLEKIDIICVKAFERGVDLIEDCCAEETVLVLVVFGDCKFGFVVDMAGGCKILVGERACH
jgi:vacuolar-type H+-ATPase subunit E/Vma4